MHEPNRLRDEGARCSLVMPCYNEALSLPFTATAVADAFRLTGLSLELVLVDNGSSDSTGTVIDQLLGSGLPIRKVIVGQNRGKGFGVLQGLNAATGDWLGFLDADCPVRPDDVAHMFRLAAASPGPVLLTTRRRYRLDGLKRRIVSSALNLIANLLFPGLGTHDLNANPKVWPRSLNDRLHLSAHDWCLDLELVLQARTLEVPIIEVNALSQPRPAGRSHVVSWRASVAILQALIRFRLYGARREKARA